MPRRYSLSHDLKRFAVEFLCLLLMLQGFPAQALQSDQHTTVETSPEDSRATGDDGPLEAARDWISTAAETTRQAFEQPWTSAIGLMLGLSTYAVPQDEAPAEMAEDTPPTASDKTTDSPPAETTTSETPPAPSLNAPSAAAQLRVATKPRSADRLAISKVQRQAQRIDVSTLPPTGPVRAPAPQPAKRRGKSIAPEITALAESLNGSPAAILRHVHDTIHYDPGHGADSPPVGTLWEGRGTAWDQAWLLQDLLIVAGVDARLEWGEIEITPDLLTTLAGVDDPIRAADLLTTAGVPIVLVIGGSQVIAARMPHVWVKAHLDFIPDRGIKHGTPDQWIRIDPTLKDHPVIEGQRTDDDVFFVLADHLQSGTEKSPRQVYEEDLLDYVGSSDLDAFKSLRTLKEERFPFVPGTLRAKILSIDGLAETVPTSKQVSLEVTARQAGGAPLFTWTSPLPSIYGKALELRWPGATSADQANLDLYGGIYTTPPYEIELAAELALEGAVVKTGGAIGAAEDVELTAKITPPGDVSTHARWDLFAGEHAVLGFDRGRGPQQVIDQHAHRATAATDADSQETYRLAAAGATYLHKLGEDLDHLGALRWHRVVPLGTAVLAIQRGAVSTFPNGSPETFSRGPLSLELGAMPLGLFPADGVQVGTVRTLELLGSQASVREGEALAAIFGGEHPTAVGFLKQAVREDQTLTRVDTANLEATLAVTELGEDAEASVRDAIAQGKIAWVAESQLDINGWDTSGYVVQEPGTGLGGYFVTFERLITALDGAVTFHSPQDLDVVTAPTDVVASIDAEGLQSWTLSTRPVGSGTGEVIASGTGPVENTTLGQFDPTLLLNGLHELILTGTDAAGQTVSGKVAVSVEGQMKIGHFTLSFIDLAIPVSGLDIEVVRTYDSRQRHLLGDFGQGWTLGIRQGSYRNNRPPGDGWQIPGTAGPWGLPCSTVHETKSHLTTVRLSDQEVYRFRLALRNPATVIGGCYADAVFEWVDGPLPGTTLEVLGATQVFVATGSSRAVLPDTQEPFVPEDVKLTTRDGRIFHLDLAEGVTHVEDLNGNFLDITPEGITHSSGKGIDFERDAEGRITKITDPIGHSNRYEYDNAGDLVAFIDRVDATTRFTYKDDHYLEDIENALGARAVRTEYDADGRVVRMIDAAGAAVALDHDLDARREVITNRLGFVRVLEYDERGNVIRETDELGNVTLRTYDSNDNLRTERDPLDQTTTFTYTAGNDVQSIRDPLGQVTTLAHDSRGLPLTLTDALGQVTTNTYSTTALLTSTRDPEGNTTTFGYTTRGELNHITDALGQVTAFDYDSTGNLLTQTNALGHSISFAYDANGNRIREIRTRTSADGTSETLTTAFAYDALGRLVSVTAPDGSVTHTEYDALGRITRTVDALGHATAYTYDGRGLPITITYADGTTSLNAYDAEGQRIASTDPLGRTTEFAYDPVGRLVSTTYPGADALTETQTYDAAGRLVASTDARGFTTTQGYDAAGRRILVTDALGNTTAFAYDADNRIRQVTDPLGHTTEYQYNAHGLLRFVVAPDETRTETVYDALGRQIATIDQAGHRTDFAYDAVGRLNTVTDALDQVTSYGYDELGNLIRQTDANGHSTRFEFDAQGRQTARILPDGARETFTYDAAGRLSQHTDFNGATRSLTYDSRGRLLSRQYSDGTSHTFTYTATGQRASATGERGGVTLYEYDERDRLVRKTDPTGHRLDYAYDAVGGRTRLTATVGSESYATLYTYDALGQVSSVTDPRGGVYTFTYDAGGRPERLQYPSGIITTWNHDDQNRLTDLVTQNTSGDVLRSFHYTLAPTGHRTSVTEEAGTTRAYSYDALWRLTQDRVTDGAGGLTYQEDFEYDPVGNRLRSTWTSAEDPPRVETYTYDGRNRLTSIGGQPLSWDAAGRLLTKPALDGTPGATYSWWLDDRLLEAELDNGTVVRTTYDVEGNRTQTEQGTGGELETVAHLVDDSPWLSQGVVDIGPEGLDALYIRAGDRLLGLIRDGPESDRYYHTDGLGSVRTLSDTAGATTGTLDYTAFGERLTGSDTTQVYGFAGEPWSLAGLAYHRARWMDPGVGRFLSRDPFSGWPGSPASQHGYGYADQSPLNLSDPSGLFTLRQAAISAVVGLLTTVTAPALANLLGYQITTVEAIEAGKP